MIQPSFAECSRLAKQGNLIPVYDVFPADLLTPVSAHLRIAEGARYAFQLESAEGGEKIARYTCRRSSRRGFPLCEWSVRTGNTRPADMGGKRPDHVPARTHGTLPSGASAWIAPVDCR